MLLEFNMNMITGIYTDRGNIRFVGKRTEETRKGQKGKREREEKII